jgi:hypothetical protein
LNYWLLVWLVDWLSEFQGLQSTKWHTANNSNSILTQPMADCTVVTTLTYWFRYRKFVLNCPQSFDGEIGITTGQVERFLWRLFLLLYSKNFNARCVRIPVTKLRLA